MNITLKRQATGAEFDAVFSNVGGKTASQM